MKTEDQNMDEQFRKIADEINVPYRSEFWKEVESQLADDSMDSAFRKAAGSSAVMPDISITEEIADAYLDEAFNSASSDFSVEYNTNYWQEFLKQEAILEQDVAFMTAANSVTADYHSAYWTEADIALQNEGLHYEYRSSYWNDAKQLLDQADRRIFFMRWSAVAGILLLLSFGTFYQPETNSSANSENTASGNNPSITHIALAGSEKNSPPSNYLSGDMNDHSNPVITLQNDHANQQKTTNLLNPDNQKSIDLNLTDQQQDLSVNTSIDVTDNRDANISSTPDFTSQEKSSDQSVQNMFKEEMDADLVFSLKKNQPVSANISGEEKLNAPLVEIKKPNIRSSHQISFIANAGVGNKYGKTEFFPSLRTSFGIEYLHTGYGRLRNFEFGASVSMIHARQNDFGTERRVSVFNSDGGVDKFWYKLQLKDFIYTNVSGLMSFKLTRKQNLRLSLGMDYLMFVQSNLSYKTDADKGITTVNNNWGVKDGLSKLDLRMGLGYEYHFSHRFSGQVNGNFGFFDRTDDSFIEKSFFDQEMSITLGLKYTFIRKS